MNRKDKKRMQTRKNIISYLLSFLLMISLISLSLIFFGNYSMFSIHGVEHTCEKVDYYTSMKGELMQRAYDLAIPYGLDKVLDSKKKNKKKAVDNEEIGIVFLDDVFSKKQISHDIKSVVNAEVYGTEDKINVDDLKSKIDEHAGKSQGTLTKKQQESLDEYTRQICQMYQDKMVIPGISYIAKGIRVVSKIRWFVIPICIFFILLSIFLLVSMRTMVHRGLRFVAYGVLGAGVTLTTVFAAMISDGAIYKLNISNAFMRSFFTFFIGHEMLMQVLCGIGMVIAGIVIIIITARMKLKGKTLK